MKKAEQPLMVVGTLLSISIAFWGKDMAEYIEKRLSLPSEQAIWQKAGTNTVACATNEAVSLVATSFWHLTTANTNRVGVGLWRLVSQELKATNWIWSATNSGVPQWTPAASGTNSGAGVTNQPQSATNQSVCPINAAPQLAEKFRMEACAELAKTFWAWAGILIAGTVFMLDIMCVYWWYARYIYRIQPRPRLGTYFMDFGVCASFTLAAARWTVPAVFCSAAGGGSIFLYLRFLSLYRSQDASDSDRYILKRACVILVGAVILIGSVSGWLWDRVDHDVIYPVLVTALSGVGIFLTCCFRENIRHSVDRHEIAEKRLKPMKIHWPPEIQQEPDTQELIRSHVADGLKGFRDIFSNGLLRHQRLLSRVHAEGDLHVQSYVLALSSWRRERSNGGKDQTRMPDLLGEMERKAWVVGMSHWLDDLVDGRKESEILRALKDAPEEESAFSLRIEHAAAAFVRLYRRIIIEHTDKKFFDQLIRLIGEQTTVPANRGYLFLGLNRVALGSAIYSPVLPAPVKRDLLRRHNLHLFQLVEASDPPAVDPRWLERVRKALNRLEEGRDELGDHLLGLTTKTVMELSMASEGPQVYFPLSLLYSLLYAPLLYFHDVDREVELGEISVLETFDVQYEAIIPWMKEIKGLILDYPDERQEARLAQARMAFSCFEEFLPKVALDELRSIYTDPPSHPAPQASFFP